MKIFLALALLFCPLPGLADAATGPATEEAGAAGATAATNKAHPDLLRLEQELSRKLDDKKDGRVTPEQYQAWKGEFRARLDAAIALVPQSPDNSAAQARIMAQLGEGEAAHAALDQALEQNPKSSVLLTTKGQVLYDQKDFPGAAQNALQAWESSGHTDKGAWALYQMSKGRSAPSGTASASPSLSPLTQGSPGVSTDDSNKPLKLAVKGSAFPGLVPTPGQVGTEPIKREGGLPLWPLAVPLAGGLIAIGLYRGGKQSGEEEAGRPPAEALISAPLISAEPAALVGGAARNIAKGAVLKTLGDIAVTGVAAVGILVTGGTALIVATNHGLNEVIAAQDKYNEAIDTHRDDRSAASGLPGRLKAANEDDDHPVYVVRAGEATARNLKNSVDRMQHPSGVPGFSVQSKAGLTVKQLAAAGEFPHTKISVTTVARLTAAGVRLVPTSGTGYHNTAITPRPLSDAAAARISAAFDSPIPNPHPVRRGSASQP